jgi:nucleoside-diphosphate-sugar epimerase
LVTGANGQIGWELRRSLISIGNVIAIDRDACDLSRPRDLSAIIRDIKPDVIVNAAAYTAVDKAEDEEEFATVVNGTAVGVIAEEARRLGALLVHYSTDYVFDGAKDSPYAEDDQTSSRTRTAGPPPFLLMNKRAPRDRQNIRLWRASSRVNTRDLRGLGGSLATPGCDGPLPGARLSKRRLAFTAFNQTLDSFLLDLYTFPTCRHACVSEFL